MCKNKILTRKTRTSGKYIQRAALSLKLIYYRQPLDNDYDNRQIKSRVILVSIVKYHTIQFITIIKCNIYIYIYIFLATTPTMSGGHQDLKAEPPTQSPMSGRIY